MAITNGPWQWAIALEAKLWEKYELPLLCIDRYSFNDDEQAFYILHLGDGRKRMWWRCGEPSYAELLLMQREAYGENVGIFWGGILQMVGQIWCISIGHWMPQSSTKTILTRHMTNFGGWQLHTPQCATYYSIPDSMQREQNSALAYPFFWYEMHCKSLEPSEAQVERAYGSQ